MQLPLGHAPHTSTMSRKVITIYDHHSHYDPMTWSPEYRTYVQRAPAAAAVGQAQDHMSYTHPEVAAPPPTDTDSASTVLRTILNADGHQHADDAFVMRHPHPERGASQTGYVHGVPGILLHPDRWNHGTIAHEAAHITHSRAPNEPLADADNHGWLFVDHYARHLEVLFPGAGPTLIQKYSEARRRVTHFLTHADELPRPAERFFEYRQRMERTVSQHNTPSR